MTKSQLLKINSECELLIGEWSTYNYLRYNYKYYSINTLHSLSQIEPIDFVLVRYNNFLKSNNYTNGLKCANKRMYI